MRIFISFFLIVIVACSSKQKNETPVSPPALPDAVLEKYPQIDYVGLQRNLGLDFAVESLGHREKMFNTCGAGYGFSASNNCRQAYFTVIYFQLLCRNSTDTISTILSPMDLFPLSGRKVRWSLREKSGVVDLDSQGFGQISVVMPRPSRAQRVRLAAGNDFLYMRAGEINRVVTPKNWCNP